MAEEEKKDEGKEKKGGGLLKPIIWTSVGFVIGAIGFSIPLFVPSLLGGGGDATEESAEAIPRAVVPAFIEYGKVVSNIGEAKMNRYLALNLSLQIDEKDLEELTALVEKKRPILHSWLLNHLSDKSLDDIRGAAGQNQMRREIHDKFNSVLFPDGNDRIDDVLFLEFNVQ